MTKPRITRMVALTAGIGFVLGAATQQWQFTDLAFRGLGCVIGTALSASGANALNQWWERARDAQMPRTATRPLPTGRVSSARAMVIGLGCGVVGALLLLLTCGSIPACISIFTILTYVLAYTPLKPVTTFNTIIGAIPGALPPLIGWVAAASGNSLRSESSFEALSQPGGWSLFALMFVWQIPHVLGLAWMYNDDYAKGGYQMLPMTDPTGQRTARMMVLWSLVFIPVSISPALFLPTGAGWLYGGTALITGVAFLFACLHVLRSLTVKDARRVFIASVIHLPILLCVLVADTLLATTLW